MRWASRYWEQFGDHYMLLCLEHSNSQLGYESLITTIYKGKISPFHILDDYNFQEAPISLRSCIDSFMLWLEKEKVQSRITTNGKQALKKIGYDFESSGKPHRPITTPENAVILEKNIPSRDLSSPTSIEYQKTYQEWQKKLLQKIDCDTENQKNLEDLPLREIFMYTVNHVLIGALFDEHIHQENCTIQALILVHKSPCKDTRTEIIKKLMRLINPHTQISISWVQRLTQHMNLPIQAQVPLENQLAKSFVDKITENKASEQDLMKIAGLIHNQMIGDRKIQEATRFYQRILEFIITPIGILDELKYLTQWLQLYDNTTQYLYSLNAQHQILYYLADLKDSQYSSIQITTTFEYLAPYLQDKLIPTLPQFPKIIYFLSKPEHLALIPGSSNKLKVHIQSHIAFLSLHIHKHKIGEKNFSTEKPEVQTALEKSIQQFQAEKKDLQEEVRKLLTTQKKQTQEQNSLTSEISQLNHKQREQNHTYETLLKKQEDLTNKIHSKDQTIDKQATELQKLQQKLSLLNNEKKALQHTIEIYESREVEANHIQKKLDKSIQLIDLEKKKREEAERCHNQILQKEKRQIQNHHDEMQKQEQEYQTITHIKSRMETKIEELTEKLSLALRTVEKKHQSTQTITEKNADLLKHLPNTHTEKKQPIAETEKIRSKNTEKEKAFYIESRSFLNQQEKNPFTKKGSHRGSKELNGHHYMENMQGFFSTPTAFTPMAIPVILETSSSVKEHRFLIHVNRLGQLLAQTPGVHHLNWCGTSAIEFTRSHWKNLDLSHLFRNLQEDIDLRVQGSISAQSLQELTTSWPQLKLKSRKTMRYCEKITLELEDNDNKLLFDLQVSSSLPPKQTPDRIEWHWDISQGQWQIHLQSLTPIQQAFLYQTEPYGTTHIEHYSLFWALHQVIKHQELGNTSPTTHILLGHILSQTNTTTLAQAVNECIDHFNNTPYWSSTLNCMIYYPMPLNDKMVAPLINALIPRESSIFGKLLAHNTIDTQVIPDKTCFYECLKSIWANYEPNTKLLDSTTPINWGDITLEPQNPLGLKK